MPALLPKILVIDDILGRVLVGRTNNERRDFCEKYNLNDITEGEGRDSTNVVNVSNPVADVVFCRGQRREACPPGESAMCSPAGTIVENDLALCLSMIRDGWNRPHDDRCWSLLLLDMCFLTGRVPSGDQPQRVVLGHSGDTDPNSYFGLKILDAIDHDSTLDRLPVVILSSMGRDEIERRFAHRAVAFLATDAMKAIQEPDQFNSYLSEFGLIGDDSDDDSEFHIAGKSVEILNALKDARPLSVRDQSILIEGETGTGKELMARFLHNHHPERASGPLVAVNCRTLQGELWKSDLFGHKKGSFTGAATDRVGFILQAEGGDLFFDELSRMPLDVQEGLLRVIQTKRIHPVGATEEIGPIDVRFLCATNENLQQLVKEGKFREDLFFRLAQGKLLLPPLRERRRDIPLLVDRIIRRRRIREGDNARDWKPTDEAIRKLIEHSWPGNVRELNIVVENAINKAFRLNLISDRHVFFSKNSVHTSNGSSSPVADNKAGTTRISVSHTSFQDYEIKETIGDGGMGIVSKALHKRLGHTVAIKQIRKERLNESSGGRNLKRFEGEARTAAALRHPGIVRVHDFGEDGSGGFFFAMDYIDGVTLHQKLAEQPDSRFQNREAVSLLLSIVEAVEYAHSCSVIHRDLKPKNIIIDKIGRPVIADFGICKSDFIEAGITQHGEILGTIAYMSPEQLGTASKPSSHLADIYSLGAILYRLITGRPPLGSDEGAANIVNAYVEATTKTPERPSILNPNVDIRLENICLKCLAKDPDKRYASALQLANELRTYLGVSSDLHTIVRSLSSNPLVAFENAENSMTLKNATAAAAGLVLSCLNAQIPDSIGSRVLSDLFEEITGSRDTNVVETKASQLFTGLLNVAPESTRITIFTSQKLVWAARRAIKRNKGIHKQLGGACLLCRFAFEASSSSQSISNELTELLTRRSTTKGEQVIDVDYSWCILDRILTAMTPDAKEIAGFLVAGGRELLETTTELEAHIESPRLLDAALVQSLNNELGALPPVLPPELRIYGDMMLSDLDPETLEYYRDSYAEIRSFVGFAAEKKMGMAICRK
jgi:DNA-binding NtrC family response regulator/tRNA A-37 threonylcarbamoyl transferase component Bud32